MEEKNSNNYLSLQNATKQCKYSQEYLSLRARQGKLKAVKFGRNWVTKKEWLEEYLEKIEEYNNNNLKDKVTFAEKPIVPVPPRNLPVKESISFQTFLEEKLKKPALRFSFVTGLVFLLLIAGGIFGKNSFRNVYKDVVSLSYEISENLFLAAYLTSLSGDIIAEETAKSVKESFINVGYQVADIGGMSFENFTGYTQWLFGQIAEIKEKYTIANNFVEKNLKNIAKKTQELRNILSSIIDKSK